MEHLIYPVCPDPATLPGRLNVLNEDVFTVILALLAGKPYPIFTLSSGFTSYTQYSNQRVGGKDFGYRFLWRLLLLTIFATLSTAFYPAGDALLPYTIMGVALFAMRKWSNKTVLIMAIIFLLQPMEWYRYIASLFSLDYQLPNLGVGEVYSEMVEHTKRGDLWNFVQQNMTLGQKASLLWAVGAGWYIQTCGLFMLGMLIGCKKLFILSEGNPRFWMRTLVIATIAFGPLCQPKVLLVDAADSATMRQKAGVMFDMWQKSALAFVLMASFVLLYQREAFKRLASTLRSHGKMSLANYVTQSFAGTLIYLPIDSNLAPYYGHAVNMFIDTTFFFL